MDAPLAIDGLGRAAAASPLEGSLLLLFFVIAAAVLVVMGFALAAVVFRIRNERKARRWARLEAKWEPVIVPVLSGVEPSTRLIERVAPGEELHFVDFVYRYARRLRGRERIVLAELALPYLPPIARRVHKGDPEQRARAVQTLSVLGLPRYAETVVGALDDPSPLVAMIAARTLARAEYVEHAGEVLARLHRFEAWSPKFLASMLAGMGAAVSPTLRVTLADGGVRAEIRAVAADALRKLNDLGAADVAARILATERHPELLAATLRLLRRVGRPEHVPLVRALVDSADFVVRAQAISALGRLGRPEDLAPLRQAFEDSSPWVALHAARGLRHLDRGATLRAIARSDHPRASFARQILAE